MSEKTLPPLRLLEHYRNVVISEMKKKFGLKNNLEVPRLEKIVVNMGIKMGATDKAVVEAAVEDLAMITGQRPVITRAKKSVAGFKLREGQPLGCKVTLRGRVMYEFLDRLISVAIPRVRDFRGLSPSSFDGQGNYTFGLTEQIVFPEMEFDKVKNVLGMDITLVTSTQKNEQARAFLEFLGLPLVRIEKE